MINTQLIKEIKTGNPDAFKELFRITYPRLKGYCRLFIRDSNQIEDILQESFIILWEKRTEIRLDKNLESYIFLIVRNRCLNLLKENKLKDGIMDPVFIPVNELQYLYQLDFLEKEEKSLEEQLIVSLQQAIDCLPDRMKEVFIKCKINGEKQDKVATELGISVKTVEMHISSAKQKITKQLLRQYPILSILITSLIQ